MKRPEARSPISAANPNRKDLNNLNRDAAKGPKRPAPNKGPEFNSREQYQKARPETRQAGKNGAVQGTYKGAKPANANVDRMAQGKAAGAAASRDMPKVQGNYAGNKNSGGYAGNNKAGTRDSMAKPATRPANTQNKAQNRPSGDRGYADKSNMPNQKPAARPEQRPEQRPQQRDVKKPQQRPEQRPQQRDVQKPQQRPEQRQQQQRPQQHQQQRSKNAMSGSKQSGSQARAASQRGQQSRPEGSGGNRSGKRN